MISKNNTEDEEKTLGVKISSFQRLNAVDFNDTKTFFCPKQISVLLKQCVFVEDKAHKEEKLRKMYEKKVMSMEHL